MTKLFDLFRHLLYLLYLQLQAWERILENASNWIDWVETPPHDSLAFFYYWQFWTELSPGSAYITWDMIQAKREHLRMYPHIPVDDDQ